MKLLRMRVLTIFTICLAPCANAQAQGAAYGTVKAIFEYCGRIDSEHRNEYETYGAKVLSSLATTGDSGDYQFAYETTTAALNKTPANDSRTKCTLGIGLTTHTEPGDDRREDGRHDDRRGVHR